MSVVKSEDECNSKSRLRSWSMLEIPEMHTIHNLTDNMESILCKPSLSKTASKDWKDPTGQEQEPCFLFYDVKDDTLDNHDESSKKNSVVNHNFTRKLGWMHKNNSFAFGDGSMESMAVELDTAHHLHQNLKLYDELKPMDKSAPNEDLTEKMEYPMEGKMLNEYISARTDQTSPNEVTDVVQIEKNQKQKQPEAVCKKDSTTQHSLSMGKLSQMMGESYITKSQDSMNQSVQTTPSRRLPALLAPKTMPKLKTVVKTPSQAITDNSSLDSSNGSSTVTIGSADGVRKSILKRSSSIGKFPKEADSSSTGREGFRRTASFSTLEIRSYDITIGDNPGGSHGAPVSLSWDYNPDNTIMVDLETYEKTRPQRRARSEMYMSGSIRMFLLMKNKGYSLREIEAAAKDAEKLRKKRQNTIKKEQFRHSIGKLFSRSK